MSEHADRAGSAAKRPDPTTQHTKDPTGTEAGQEAIRGQEPADRDQTHQSNYGGGGTHGGNK